MVNLGFWGTLKKPFFVLAPLANVTDAAFRSIIAERGKPDVFYTEFVSADGLAHEKARDRLKIDLLFSELEHPIVAQIFGSRPANIEYAAGLCREQGFDGIDINMGCPDRGIEKQGAGAAMIKHPALAPEIIAAAKRGAQGLPVSVKTRLGYYKTSEMEEWLGTILACEPAVLTVHLRTREEMSKVPAHWELASRLAELRGNRETLLMGNGDVLSLSEAQEKAKSHQLDGIMLGRAIFGNPWLFAGKTATDIEMSERLATRDEHARRFHELFIDGPLREGKKPHKGAEVMRKFYRNLPEIL